MYRGLHQKIALLGAAALLAGCAALLAGCGALPSAGPTSMEVVSGANSGFDGYIVVDIDQRVASILASEPQPTLYGTFPDRRPRPDLRIGVGDSVTVTIWEAASGGLFSSAVVDRVSAGSRSTTVPEQTVAQDGTIQVPYAGAIKAAGKRPAEVEKEIVNALKGKAIEPQAVVTITKNLSNTVTVSGEVTNGMRVPLTLTGDRILTVVAEAGGIRVPARDCFVRLTRGNRTVSVAFNKILANPRENIYVRPGDVVTVVSEPQTFTAFGGTKHNASVPFNSTGITLEEAIAKAGGLLDYRADPTGVFLLRFEAASIAAKIKPDNAPFTRQLVPIIYRLNLRNANSYFLARTIPMHNRDILYVANAPITEIDKVLNVIGHITQPVVSGAALYTATTR